MQDKLFPQGMTFKIPDGATKEKCPWIKGKISIKVEDFTKFLQENNNNGWLNIDLKMSKDNKLYLEVNTWKPAQKVEGSVDYPANELSNSPF